jgi:hypothetical protein
MLDPSEVFEAKFILLLLQIKNKLFIVCNWPAPVCDQSALSTDFYQMSEAKEHNTIKICCLACYKILPENKFVLHKLHT